MHSGDKIHFFEEKHQLRSEIPTEICEKPLKKHVFHKSNAFLDPLGINLSLPLDRA